MPKGSRVVVVVTFTVAAIITLLPILIHHLTGD